MNNVDALAYTDIAEQRPKCKKRGHRDLVVKGNLRAVVDLNAGEVADALPCVAKAVGARYNDYFVAKQTKTLCELVLVQLDSAKAREKKSR